MRNPDAPPPKKKVNIGGIKNWLILGVVGAGGYVAYKYFTKHEETIKKEVQAASGKKVAGPDLNGPMVTKYMIASTQSKTCISAPEKGFVYAPITSTNPLTGYNTFSATATGHYTRRLLCRGGQKWAEIKPSGALGSLGEFIDLGFGKRVLYYAP